MKLHPDLREFIELLHSRGVDFVIVGGVAVAFHGHPRYTGDIDVLVQPTLENAKRLFEVLHEFGFESIQLTPAEFCDDQRVIQLGKPPNRIDLLSSISGVSAEEVWRGRVSGPLGDLSVSYIGREQLTANKRAAGRLKDLADLDQLE